MSDSQQTEKVSQDAQVPYLSVVVTSRNDGHGGDPLGRLQAFINTFDAQCRRFGLDAELIVVEWNPPVERPRLHDLVRRPASCSFDLRFIEVPPAFHEGLPQAHVLPLFQMIGKNVGVRRSRGAFVLCTNIDIIFSNALVEFFASGALRPGVIYRVDRHDIESDYPIDGALDEQQEYCARHQLRVHRAFGTFPVDAVGHMVALNVDVFDPPAVTIADGWHGREGDQALGFYRWATRDASLIVDREGAARAGGSTLLLDIEPNPYDPGSWIELEVMSGPRVLAHARLTDRETLAVPLPEASDARSLNLRTVAVSPSGEASLPAFERRSGLCYRLRSARLTSSPTGPEALNIYEMDRWRNAHVDALIERSADGIAVRSAAVRQSYCLRYGPLYPPRGGRYTFMVECSCLEGNVSLHIVDEATDRWVAAEQYQTTAGGRRRVFLSSNLESGRPCSLYVANRHRGGDRVSTFVVHAVGGSVPLAELEPRIDAASLLRAAHLLTTKVLRGLARRAVRRRRPFPEHGDAQVESSGAQGPEPSTPPPNPITARIEEYLRHHRPAAVHRNAAGDFQLMARRDWFRIHGYAEFTMYSMNIDGLLGDVAQHAGVTEEVLSVPRCIYHLEHEQGSGWTPEGEGLLRKRLSDSGADWLDAATVDLWSGYMDWLKRPMLFNPPDWGFGDAVLPEIAIAKSPTVPDA